MSKIIGIGPLNGHDPAVSLIVDGKVVFVAEEEKLTGIKSTFNRDIFPSKGLELLKQKFDIDLHTCDHITQPRAIVKLEAGSWRKYNSIDLMPTEYRTDEILNKLNFFSHHQCHALGSYFTSGLEGKTIALSHDGGGVRSRGKIYLCEDGKCDLIHSQWYARTGSLGHLWALGTIFLGWVESKDEGKVVGLAAHGQVQPWLYECFSQSIQYNNLEFKGGDSEPKIWYIFTQLRNTGFYDNGKNRADFAATMQKFLEDKIFELLSDLHQQHPEYRKLSLAGGVFANVKLNQFINELEYFDEIYIHPAMGDAGLSLGSAICKAVELDEIKKPLKLNHVFFGQNFSEKEWDQEAQKHNVVSEDFNIQRVASLINSGSVVGLFIGNTEYGPRALGNRSILVRATDAETHQKLNERLSRNETMPFAPSVLSEYVEEIFECHKSKHAAEFMTMCYETKDEWVHRIPAVVQQLDKSSRPQIVQREANPLYYDIINEYRKISGLPIVLNTSLNAHGDPINNYPHQAMKLLTEGCLDFLVNENKIYSCKY